MNPKKIIEEVQVIGFDANFLSTTIQSDSLSISFHLQDNLSSSNFVERDMLDIKGIDKADFSTSNNSLSLYYNPNVIKPREISKTISSLGYHFDFNFPSYKVDKSRQLK